MEKNDLLNLYVMIQKVYTIMYQTTNYLIFFTIIPLAYEFKLKYCNITLCALYAL